MIESKNQKPVPMILGAIQTHRYIDLQGRLCTKPVGKGIYIQNGKKVVSCGATDLYFNGYRQ